MENINKPRLVYFQWKNTTNRSNFVQLHMQHHVKCLSEFFEVIVVNQDCDYKQICENYNPEITLFESGIKYIGFQRLKITNTSAHPEIPKLGFHNGDSWCDCRPGFLSDMEHWGIETFFSLCTTTAEHTPEIAENLFVWPNFIDADIYKDYGQSKIIPVLFSGYISTLYPWRQKIYKIISQHYPSLNCPHLGYNECSATRMLYGEKYARTINASWFVPTCGSVEKEVVRKHFEIPGAKSCLITEKTPALEAAGFIDMQNCVFADESDVLDKLDYLFQHQDQLEKIIHAGYELVHSRHTLKQRNQIFQWFNLYKHLQPDQKIVQTNPFEPLTITETSSGINNSHIRCNGLVIELIRQGDNLLWAGKYEEAESFYLRGLSYIFWMPEPKLKIALCNLYRGDAATAFDWLLKLNRYTLETYKAVDPEPVEWAYFIIALLCQGKLVEASKYANEYPTLRHPELERIRWAINLLTNQENKYNISSGEQSNYRYSIHQLPHQTLPEWFDNLCTMLRACQQFDLVNKIDKSLHSEHLFVNIKPQNNSIFYSKNIKKYAKEITSMLLRDNIPSRPQYVLKIRRFISINLIKNSTIILHNLENIFGCFLPYRFSKMRNDDFFSEIEKIVREEDIRTVLVIGASAGRGSTEAILKGIQENSTHPRGFCINLSNPGFLKLQKRYANSPFVRCYGILSSLKKDLPKALEDTIREIHKDHKIKEFDTVLIERSDLTISTLLDIVKEAKFVLIDDLTLCENYHNYYRLITDSNYALVAYNPSLRNGYAIFKKLNHEAIFSTPSYTKI
jgi:hypothetical protein